MKDLDKYRGCLLGGAAGDALGYFVEFMDLAAITRKYGAEGITEYALVNGVARISDDTQMTLFTANGLLLGRTRGMTRGIMGSYLSYIDACYKEWYRTQTEKYPLQEPSPCSWLINIPALFCDRAPGNTCLSAMEQAKRGTIEKPINHSKGCGGVMRVAPIGLYFEADASFTQEQIDCIGAQAAALTHGHPLGYIPAAALVHIISLLAHNADMTLLDAVLDMKQSICQQFQGNHYLQAFISIIEKAVSLAGQDQNDREAIGQLGEGWVAEETLAIALYCALKYENNFDQAILTAVNHDGDSDSTGAVTGNILGAYLGLSAVPQKYTERLELTNVILELADDLYEDCKMTENGSSFDAVWYEKYVKKTYTPDAGEN